MNLNMENAAIELDKWLRFAGCAHTGYIAVAVGIESPDDDVGLIGMTIIDWDTLSYED